MQKEKNSLNWKPVGSKTLLKTKVFDVHEIESISPEKNAKKFITLKAPNWVMIIPEIVDENNNKHFLMVQQWRHGASRLFKEFPGGVVECDETPKQAAYRELLEETGYQADEITQLAELSPNPAIMENTCYIFFAKCSKKTHNLDLDENEFLTVTKEPVDKVLSNMGKPPYNHALVCAAAMHYIQKIKKS